MTDENVKVKYLVLSEKNASNAASFEFGWGVTATITNSGTNQGVAVQSQLHHGVAISTADEIKYALDFIAEVYEPVHAALSLKALFLGENKDHDHPIVESPIECWATGWLGLHIDMFGSALRQDLIPIADYERKYIQSIINEFTKRRDRPGYVYLIKSVTGHYKIGRTKNPDDRMATFSVKLPFEVEYDHIIEADDMYTLEDNLHKRFANKHINGEWFNLDTQDVAFIKSLSGGW